jgi:hypothetical protein
MHRNKAHGRFPLVSGHFYGSILLLATVSYRPRADIGVLESTPEPVLKFDAEVTATLWDDRVQARICAVIRGIGVRNDRINCEIAESKRTYGRVVLEQVANVKRRSPGIGLQAE